MPLRDYALTLVVVVVWGLNFVAVKIGVGQFPPFLLTALRFVLVGALVVPFFRVPRARFPWLLVLSFTFGTLHFGLLFQAMEGLDASTTAIVAQLGVPFSTILAVLFLRDRLGVWRTGGLVLAFTGTAVLAGEPQLPAFLPFVLAVTAALGWAVSNLLIKKVADVNPIAVTGWVSLLAVPQAALWSAVFEENQWDAIRSATWEGWGAFIFIAVGSSIVAYSLWYHLLGKHPVNHVVPFNLLAPVIGVIASVIILGEPLTWFKVIGGALTIAGVGIILKRQGRRAPLVPPEVEPAIMRGRGG